MSLAVGYIRVSTEDQSLGGHSLEAQEAAIRKYCDYRNIELTQIYIDAGVSASIPLGKRPAGKRLCEAITERKASEVVAVKLDRLFRSASDCLVTVEGWDKTGIGFHVLDMEINTTTPQGKLLLTIMAAVAEMERQQARARTKATATHLKDSGQVYGTTPYGSDRAGKKLVPNPVELAVKERMQVMRASMSYTKIANQLNEEGIPAKSGGKWHPFSVQKVLGEVPVQRAK